METRVLPRYLHPQTPALVAGRLGVIDIGSSMVRLVVYADVASYPHLLLNQKVWTALGKGKRDGEVFVLDKSRMARTRAALEWFLWVAERAGCKQLVAVATSAVREAVNGADFVAEIERDIGLKVTILSGEEEARLAAEGAWISIPDANGLVVDLGGGSIEICETSGEKRMASLPYGVLALQAMSQENPQQAVDFLLQKLSEIPWLATSPCQSILALGSGMRAIARLHMSMERYPFRILHDYTLCRDSALSFCGMLSRGEWDGKLEHQIKVWRDLLPFRAGAIYALMQATQAQNVRFATFGLREGILFTQSEGSPVTKDALCAYALDWTNRDGRGEAYARALARWAAPYLPFCDERELQIASCFAEVGWREQSVYRARSVFDVIIGGNYVAASHRQRARLAAAAYYRHEQQLQPGMREKLLKLCSKKDVQQARVMGSLFALAGDITAGVDAEVLQSFTLQQQADAQGYTLHGPPHFMHMACEVVAKRLDVLNNALQKV